MAIVIINKKEGIFFDQNDCLSAFNCHSTVFNRQKIISYVVLLCYTKLLPIVSYFTGEFLKVLYNRPFL